jgi:hypothetical protein
MFATGSLVEGHSIEETKVVIVEAGAFIRAITRPGSITTA